MPNTGRPSRDCHACRQRRTKCDLTRPGCSQCRRKRQPCPGYRDELNVRFQIENVSSFQSSMGRDRRRTREQDWESYSVVDIRPPRQVTILDQDGFPLSSERHFPLRYPLAESWNDHFMPLVMQKFSLDVCKGIFYTIPRVTSKAEGGSALYQASNAFGYAYMANINQSPKAISDQVRAYGAALTTLNLALQDPQQSNTDNTLLSAWLLGLYELFLGTQGVNSVVASSGWDIHSQGLAGLIRLRGPEQFTTHDGRNLFWIIFNTVQIRALMTGLEIAEGFTWIREIYQHCEPSEFGIVRTCIFAYHCTRLCSRIRRLVDAGDLDELLSSSSSILQDMDNVEKATHPLSDEKPITDCAIEPPLTPYTHPDLDLSSAEAYTYQSNFRIRLSYHVLEFVLHASRAPGCTPQQRLIFTKYRHQCMEEIRALVNRVSFILVMTPKNVFSSLALVEKRQGPKDHKNPSDVVGWLDAARVLCKELPERAITIGGLGTPRTVKVFVQQGSDKQSTRLFNHAESGTVVLGCDFEQ